MKNIIITSPVINPQNIVFRERLISDGNRTEWSRIQGVIERVISKYARCLLSINRNYYKIGEDDGDNFLMA